MSKASYIEIDQSALIHNINFLKTYFGDDIRISAVVKANAYGHGIEEIVQIEEFAGINHFSVFSASEAKRICNIKKENTDVMIMGWMDSDELEWSIASGIDFFISDMEVLFKTISIAQNINKKANIHIDVETGMNRTGLDEKELNAVANIIKKNKDHLNIRGICTHYAGAESIANHVRVSRQIQVFNKIKKKLATKGIIPDIYHTACPAAAMTYPRTRMDMIRIGILQFGYWPSAETFIHFISRRMEKSTPLRRVLSWKSIVMSLKAVNIGEFISYGTSYIAQEPKRLAIVSVGYAQGYSRSLSNQGHVLIGGQRAAVIGAVNMNMLIADITKIPNVEIGDEVVLIGNQGDMDISLSSFADFNNQLNYELLARLPQHTEKKIVN
ncbi:MAG: alanine racemase [Bacteroidales bacterium]|jgi:alanine racemase|nr:alanine racemase [Bacteroidales bacterium]